MSTMQKGHNGWKAKDILDFEGPYKLTIETSKDASGRMPQLVSRASVDKHTEYGFEHRFALGGGGDYSERFILTGQRCTEKSVAAQHAEAMSRLAEIQERARAHYAKYPIKEAA